MSIQNGKNTEPASLDAQTLRVVRPEVRALLEASPGFQKLSKDEQTQLAGTMVKVASYMANPDGLAAQELSPQGGILATAQADKGVDAAKQKAAANEGFAGQDFQAGAARQYTEAFGQLVQKVDFPKFVGGLIQNVFQAIVDATIQQMRAYSEMLKAVAQTVDQFMQDNITMNNSRDWLSQQFPDKLDIDTSAMSRGFAEGSEAAQVTPRVTVKGNVGDVEGALREISAELQLAQPVTDISDEAEETRLVTAARLQIARSRQQLLASMVMLGINRIVVTDGLIHAKVVFDMRASDIAQRQDRAGLFDREEEKSSSAFGGGANFGAWGFGGGTSSSRDHMTTVQTSVDETSESKGELKAKLTGEVRVNFKSDYFPMEKLASPQMIAAIQGNAKPQEPPPRPPEAQKAAQPNA